MIVVCDLLQHSRGRGLIQSGSDKTGHDMMRCDRSVPVGTSVGLQSLLLPRPLYVDCTKILLEIFYSYQVFGLQQVRVQTAILGVGSTSGVTR